MTEEVSRQMKRGWTTRDIMVTAILSIIMGVVYIPLTYLTGYLGAFPFINAIIIGIYFWPIIMIGYIIRKPGSALLSSLIAFLVMVPLTPWGIMMLSMGLLIGLPIEIAFLIGRYKFKLWSLMLAGIFSGLSYATMNLTVYGLINVSPLLQIAFFVETIVSGVLLGGLLAKFIGDAVIKTGIVSNASIKS